MHYQRHRKTGDLEPLRDNLTKTRCSHPGCERVSKSRGLCNAHYQSYRTSGELPMQRGFIRRTSDDGTPLECSVDYCQNAVASRGFCEPHYRQDRAGLPITPVNETVECPTPGCGRGKAFRAVRCVRCNQFKARYSLTDTQFHVLMASRICSNPGCGETENLHLDHDHSCCPKKNGSAVSCGKCVRGWLCSKCNWALGNLKEDPRRIEGLLSYLKSFTTR